jgi:hypothetical protein
MHGSSLQHPQKVGAFSQVHIGVSPPQDPPGDRLASDETRPAGRSTSPKQPCRHGSDVQHPTSLVPVSHAYLITVRFVLHSAMKTRSSRQRLSLLWYRMSDLPSTSTRTKEISWLSCRIPGICHIKDTSLRIKRQICRKSRSRRAMGK